jgi:hypothetical protein
VFFAYRREVGRISNETEIHPTCHQVLDRFSRIANQGLYRNARSYLLELRKPSMKIQVAERMPYCDAKRTFPRVAKRLQALLGVCDRLSDPFGMHQ